VLRYWTTMEQGGVTFVTFREFCSFAEGQSKIQVGDEAMGGTMISGRFVSKGVENSDAAADGSLHRTHLMSGPVIQKNPKTLEHSRTPPELNGNSKKKERQI
jgi:hypothetical protein